MRVRVMAVLLLLLLAAAPSGGVAEAEGQEITFDLFSIVMPDELVVLTKDNVDDGSMYVGTWEGRQEEMCELIGPDSQFYLLAYQPQNVYMLDIIVVPIVDWKDLNAAGPDQIEHEIIPAYDSLYEEAGITIYDSGYEVLGGQTYLRYEDAFPADGSVRYGVRYFTMIQVKGLMYGITIKAVNYDSPVPDEAVQFLAEAIRSVTYFDAEGTSISRDVNGYTMSFQLPITWENMGERENDDLAGEVGRWGVIEDDELSMAMIVSVDYWSGLTIAQKVAFGLWTRQDYVSVPGTKIGDVLQDLRAEEGFGAQYERIGGIWYLKSEGDQELTPSDGRVRMARKIMFMTVQEGVQYDMYFLYVDFDAQKEAEMYEVMESVCYAEGPGIEN